jgi:glyoxylase-like metal-dependent hydrolase (beta-lactamase superfamily II)
MSCVACRTLTHGLSWIDLQFQGRSRAIATAVVHAAGGVALVDPGPTSCLPVLTAGLEHRGIRMVDVRELLLTHIHLDHAGAAGTLVRAHPHMRVFVHAKGAPHMADPAKLLASATRLYGDDMDRLWGRFEAVPAANLVVLEGGERIDAAGRSFEVAYTPGHASHHVSYFDAQSGLAMVGDVAGVRIAGGFVLPPTPPPDINLDVWPESAARIERWSPSRLFLTHFGPVEAPAAHLRTLFENLRMTTGWVEESLEEPGTDEERAGRFTERLTSHMRKQLSATDSAPYPVAAPFDHLWQGLARYLRKRRSP